ncbi:WD40-repeat-containing domain protein [Kockovaella imperatae]|uniref:WD40 repeat-containing protein SMU1 n=1 Tax=Kockovaella imperatae TaxID=4999 RepID=A0A1Y1U8C3_9TREE|nr:WD40-repeat-containing domain protein [Kockovaella imperatae]ORX33747.1 WD40-repeat-containing domain protein [Kockovaella imperatae]
MELRVFAAAEAGPSSPVRRTHPVNREVVPLNQVSLDAHSIDHDIALLVSDWLHSQPHSSLASTFDQEILGYGAAGKAKAEEIEEVERAILDGEWSAIETLISRPGLVRPQTQRAFMYMCYRQQFLEHVDNREFQKAFSHLQKRLKPLEHYQPFPYDFYNLCYLTSAGTVHDAPGLRDWGGPAPEREKLVGMWRDLVESSGSTREGMNDEEGRAIRAPRGRLLELFKQAAAWQVSNVRMKGKQPWTVRSLLHDFEIRSISNHLRLRVKGHTANIKCLAFIGGNERLAVSGSSDCTLRIFSTVTGHTRHILTGHTSRIWDCSVSQTGSSTDDQRLVASASGDGTVRVWSSTGDCLATLNEDCGDVYSVDWRPGTERQLVSGCYDRILRVWDVERRHEIRTFSGHTQSVLAVAFDPVGNLLASGSKDRHVRLWDAVGGVCTSTIPACLGEVTSVDFDSTGRYLLAGSKDNSNRLWDLRMQRHLYRYTGHQNTSKNLVRCSFAGPNDSFIISGSEDGKVYIWDRDQSVTSQDGTTPAMMTADTTSLGTLNTGASADTASPAYYPPRDSRQSSKPPGISGEINVKAHNTLQPLAADGASPSDISDTSFLLVDRGGGPPGTVFDIAWIGDGEMMSAGEDGTVMLWDTVQQDDQAD